MRKFDITDIVTLKEKETVLFMVVDYADFSEEAKNGKLIEDIDYELMQIFPIQKNSSYRTVSQQDLMIKEKTGSRNHDLLLRFIQKDREKIGWYGVPDFIQVANKNLKGDTKTPVKEVKVPVKRFDVIRYDQLETIDQCLDALNDLNRLYEMFGDEAYIQLKEVVASRIVRLNK